MKIRFFLGIITVVFVWCGWLIPAWAEMPQWHGFVETVVGARVSDDDGLTKHSNLVAAEQRLQLKTNYAFSEDNILGQWQTVARLKGDFVVDEYFAGKTSFDLRDAHLAFSPQEKIDVKLGRQVLTWGTGDYIFINDVFPKDYISFYSGREDEYLKKPSDAVRVSLYPEWVNLDFVTIFAFEPNTIPEGDRLSFFDSFQGGIAGRNSDRFLVEPAWQAENFEYALRAYRSFGSAEAAVYVFRGFDKMPRSYQDEAARRLFYQRQDVYGGSVRAPWMGGIGNMEFGYVRSPQDDQGDNRLIENSMFKALAGYEKDLGNDWKVGAQYFYEQKLDYSAYVEALLPQDYFWDEFHHVLTQRITKLFKNQTVMISLFNFWSPSDRDGYVRPSASYAITDQWKVTLGANIPWGEDDLTDFGQMKKNKNVYVRARYSF